MRLGQSEIGLDYRFIRPFSVHTSWPFPRHSIPATTFMRTNEYIAPKSIRNLLTIRNQIRENRRKLTVCNGPSSNQYYPELITYRTYTRFQIYMSNHFPLLILFLLEFLLAIAADFGS